MAQVGVNPNEDTELYVYGLFNLVMTRSARVV